MRLFKSKRGITDTSIAVGIVLAFILIGTFLPYIEDEFGSTGSTYNVDDFESDVGQASVGATDVLLSVFSMFFWTFNVPIYINVILLFFRIYLAIYIYRNIRGVG